ncbi:MAG: SoxR reducing system RseC family protein [Alkalispirochaetaceae bacterium]
MKQCGRIVKIEGETITVIPDGARCPGCSGGHCHAARRTVRVRNSDGHQLSLSDRVEIQISPFQCLLDFLLLILLPVGGALLAAFPLSRALRLEEGLSQALLGLFTALLLLGANLLRSRKQRERSFPRVISVLSEGAESPHRVSQGAQS